MEMYELVGISTADLLQCIRANSTWYKPVISTRKPRSKDVSAPWTSYYASVLILRDILVWSAREYNARLVGTSQIVATDTLRRSNVASQ